MVEGFDDEAKDVISRCFETAAPSSSSTTARLLAPVVEAAPRVAGLRLDATRANFDKNFRRKFRSAVDTVRATVRMQARLKLDERRSLRPGRARTAGDASEAPPTSGGRASR